MSIHYEVAEGLCEEVDLETQSYIFNQTMLRIKDPKTSLDFYTRILGMKLYRKLDFPEMKFTSFRDGLNKYFQWINQLPIKKNLNKHHPFEKLQNKALK